MTKCILLTLAGSVALLGAAAAQAGPTYSWQGDPQTAPSSGTGGYGTKLTDFSASYDTTGILSLDIEISGQDVSDDGFWFVVNNGGNPKGIPNELAILYGDVAGGTITSYVYNGSNAPNSFSNPGIFLQSDVGALSQTGADSYGFSIDVSAINAMAMGPNWEGVRFGEEIGIWFHPIGGAGFTYDLDGGIASLSISNTGWFDSGGIETEFDPIGNIPVPAPGALALLGLGLMGLALARRGAAA
ncbi:MAG: PEP-CTERM sorting domain-containing protein [Pacificimonas sp.]